MTVFLALWRKKNPSSDSISKLFVIWCSYGHKYYRNLVSISYHWRPFHLDNTVLKIISMMACKLMNWNSGHSLLDFRHPDDHDLNFYCCENLKYHIVNMNTTTTINVGPWNFE